MMSSINKLLIRASVLPVLLVPSGVLAAGDIGLKKAETLLTEVGGTSGEKLGVKQSLPSLVGSLINAFLGVLGIIFVILVIYAGYLYMTASGDDEKVKKAKKLLGQAVIGMVIIVAAYAIATYVIGALVGAGSVGQVVK
ncbi:Mbov_0395 family pilin-like conjugal transfer protein [Patescibacteria group bacterium]